MPTRQQWWSSHVIMSGHHRRWKVSCEPLTYQSPILQVTPKPTCEPTNINQKQTTKQNRQYSLVPKKSQQNQYSPFALRVGSGSQNESYWIVRVDPSHHWHVEHCSPLHEMLIGVAGTCLTHFITLELDKTGPIQHNGRTSCM